METNTQATAQSEPEARGEIVTSGRDRREYERFSLSAAYGTLIHHGNQGPCQVLDISLSGCRIRTEEEFRDGALEPVQLTLPIQGMIVRIQGITQWVAYSHQIGIRFIHPSFAAKNQLASLLTCLADRSLAEVVKAAIAAETASRPGAPIIAMERPVDRLQRPENRVQEDEDRGYKEQAPPPPHPSSPADPNEPRIHSGETDDWPAIIRFIKNNCCLGGAIVDVGLTSCCIRTITPYSLGIHHRVEVAFNLAGLPFRLAGAIENTPDKKLIKIQFHQLSSRKRDELSQAIAELGERAREDGE